MHYKMKITLKKISTFLITAISLILISAVSHAATTDELVKDLLPVDEFAELMEEEDKNHAIIAYNNLPSLSIPQLMASVIRTLLGWSMILTIIAIVVTGIYFLTAQGKDEQISKAKDLILYLLIGLVIMASAYGLIVGLSQFNFLEAV